MTQSAFNLLAEIAEILYEDANTTNKTLGLNVEDDPITRKQVEVKGRMHLLAARIISDIMKHGGENITTILEEGVAKGLTLYHCDIVMNLPRIMPPP